ncbi:GNAT family N-acetyltransferase [Nocardiopsis trehalosi]|uniref:GNAT family N-acetyltransferase n=1 Tax=Nocardiopsis trehalosi TaxID=109329 RepID=UPI0008340EF0|nr:GNAT family N-acetyltransferase [Nocardiopsis trehalosi]
MDAPIPRPYSGPADLRRMQDLVSRVWSHAAHWHIGDLAWQRSQHAGREAEWRTALWEDGGAVAAWAWMFGGEELFLVVDPARPELADAALAWSARTADDPARMTVTVLDREAHLIAALDRAGLVRAPDPVHAVYMRRGLADLPEVEVPEGFRVRAVRGVHEAAARAQVHQAAWRPSRVTADSFREVMAAWPYRADLDLVAEAPDGSFAASCLIWFDERTGVGELEPVGTDPRWRRRGLARAVCLAALHALRGAGGTEAVVYPVVGIERAAAAAPLYTSLGFTPYARSLTYTPRPDSGRGGDDR